MKNIFILLLLFSLIIICSGSTNYSDHLGNNSKQKSIRVGEDITYVVKYLAFEIGEIRLKVISSITENNDTIYNAIAYINSYEGIPFVDLHQIYETTFDQKQNSRYFKGTIIKEDTTFTIYMYDKNKKTIHVKKGRENSKEIWADSLAKADREYQDGLSLFYYARMRTGTQKKAIVPVFINEKFEKTYINFYKETEDQDIDAVNYDIDCVYLDGETEFRGIFGLTGYFEGWFSNDQFAIPIIAKMQVIIGSITLELKNWNKKEWMPPRYKD